MRHARSAHDHARHRTLAVGRRVVDRVAQRLDVRLQLLVNVDRRYTRVVDFPDDVELEVDHPLVVDRHTSEHAIDAGERHVAAASWRGVA